MRVVFLLVLLLLAACASSSSGQNKQDPGYQPGEVAVEPTPFSAVHWKAVLVAGDDSIANFDNAVNTLDQILAKQGISQRISLSASKEEIAKGKDVALPSKIEQAFQNLNIHQGDGCFLFMTSHGSREGFYLSRKVGLNRILSHRDFGEIFNKYCGSVPSIAIISACYSGGFIDENTMQPNRIILTAARRDRTSFGCGAEFEYTYYDDCLLRSWERSQSWEGLANLTIGCVRDKERAGNITPSEPQIFLGRQMKGLRLP